MKHLSTKTAILIFILFGFLLYANSLFNSFVWDDFDQVVNNQLVHSITNIPQFFMGSTFYGINKQLVGAYYKPLMPTAFTIIYSLFGSTSFPFHLFQVSLHIINTILVYLVLTRLLNKEEAKNPNWEKNWENLSKKQKKKYAQMHPPEKKANLLSFLLALIFLIHPINTETVVYIATLQDTLFFFFGILTFYLLLKKGIKTSSMVFLTGILLLLSLLSKETGIAFILLLLVYVWQWNKQKFASYLVTNIAVLAIYFFLRFVIAHIGYNAVPIVPIANQTLFERLLNIPEIIWYYLKTFFFPQNLFIDQIWIVQQPNISQFFLPLLLDTCFFSILIFFASILHKKDKQSAKLFLFFLIWFIIGLGLHSQILSLDMTVADRWFYFPILGLLGMIGVSTKFLIDKYPQITKQKSLLSFFTIISILIIIGLSLRTFTRNFNFKDNLTLYEHDTRYPPKSYMLENDLGDELFHAGQIDQAKTHFETSIALKRYPGNLNNLAMYYVQKKDFPQADKLFSEALSLYQTIPDHKDYYYTIINYSAFLLQTAQYPKAADLSQQGLTAFPGDPKLLPILALSDYQLGKKQEALQIAEKLYQTNPSQLNQSIYNDIKNHQ